MQPLGLLGALLGGYQQGRLTKQNRDVRAAQLQRQQQENEALKKYREDSLELQRRKIANEEAPWIKPQRDAWLAALKGMPDDIQKEVEKLHSTAFTPDELSSGMSNIHTKYNRAFKGLKQQYQQSPHIAQLGDFDSLSRTWVPDYIIDDKFDTTRFPRPRFDRKLFLDQAENIVNERISGAGVEDAPTQEQILGDFINSQAAMSGQTPAQLWAMLPYTRPNQPYTGQTAGVLTSDPVQTQVRDPKLGAYDTRTAVAGDTNTTYAHALPSNMQNLPALKSFFAEKHGVGPGYNVPSNQGIPVDYLTKRPTSTQIADELIVEDLHNMFRSPVFQQKYGLMDVTDPNQFKLALQLYSNPNVLNELRAEYNQADAYGLTANGTMDERYNGQRLGDFGQSERGQGISKLIEAQPLTAQTTQYTQVPFEGRTRIPISLDDRRDIIGLERDRALVTQAVANGQLAQSKARVSMATEPQQIAKADADLTIKTLRIMLDPLKFQLQEAGFNLDKWFKENQLKLSSERVQLAAKDLIMKAAGPARALLMSADNETKNSGMMLTSLLQANQLASAIFTTNPALKNKIETGTLTPADLAEVGKSIGATTNLAVKKAFERYSASLRTRATAYSAVNGFNDIAQAWSKIEPDAVGDIPGSYEPSSFESFNGGGGAAPPDPGQVKPSPGKPALSPKDEAKVSMPRNAAGQTPGDVARSGDASNKTKPKSTPLPSTSGGGVTPSKIISDAQRKLKEKGATAGKPPVKKPTTPPKPPIKPASKKPEQRDTRFDAF